MNPPSPAPVSASRSVAVVAIVLALLTISSCGEDQPIDAGQNATDGSVIDGPNPDDGTTMPSLAGAWVLERLEVGGQDVPPPPGEDGQPIAPIMTIELGEIGGDSGCNSFGGRIEIGEDGSAAITNLAATEMACLGEGLMEFEQDYLTVLGSVNGWEAGPEGISLLAEDGRLDYVPGPTAEPAALLGTRWVLDSRFEGEGADRAAISTDSSAPEATLVLSAEEASISSDDCDPTTVAITIEPGLQGNVAIDAGDLTAATEGCANPNVSSLIDGLGMSTSYFIDGQQLVFVGFDGETIGLSAG